jgi:uncharacterized protein
VSIADKQGNDFWDVIIQKRWWIIIATVSLVIVSGVGIGGLQFSTDFRDFFDKETPQLRAFEAFWESYTYTDNVLIVLAPKNGQVFTRETLAVVEEITQQGALVPYATHVESLTNVPQTRAEGDHLFVEVLARDPRNLSDTNLTRIEKTLLSDPSIHHRLISPSGNATAVNVTIFFPGKSKQELEDVVGFVRNLAADIENKHPNINVHFGGSVMFSNAFIEAALMDLKNIFPAMYVVIILFLWIIFRSFYAMITVLLVIVFSDLTALGLAGWLGIHISSVSAQAPLIILWFCFNNRLFISPTDAIKSGQKSFYFKLLLGKLKILVMATKVFEL